MAKNAAALTAAFANATVPKVNVVVGKAYGSAYVVMNSKSIGADMVFAWPNAEIGMMDAKSAAKIRDHWLPEAHPEIHIPDNPGSYSGKDRKR